MFYNKRNPFANKIFDNNKYVVIDFIIKQYGSIINKNLLEQ